MKCIVHGCAELYCIHSRMDVPIIASVTDVGVRAQMPLLALRLLLLHILLLLQCSWCCCCYGLKLHPCTDVRNCIPSVHGCTDVVLHPCTDVGARLSACALSLFVSCVCLLVRPVRLSMLFYVCPGAPVAVCVFCCA